MTQKIEHVEPGQLSAQLTGQLKQVGEKLSDKDVADAFLNAEKTRNDFATRAVVAGLMLLAKRAAFPNGNGGKAKNSWKKYLEKHVLGSPNTRSALQVLPLESLRSAQVYMTLARRLLWQIETRTWERPNNAAHFTPEQVATLKATDPGTLLAQPESARDQIAAIVSHRSLRQLLADFRKAEQLMDDEDRENESEKKSPTIQDPQTEFFFVLESDVENIESRRQDPLFFTQEKRTIIQYAERLKAEAEEILRIVNGHDS